MSLALRTLQVICLSGLIGVACSPTPAPLEQPSNGSFASVQPLATPAAAGSSSPRLSLDAAGAVVLSWLEPTGADEELALKYARLEGDQWSAAGVVARGRDWVVSSADLPSVRWLTERVVAADWRVPSAASPYAYDIEVAVSADAGATWSEPRLLNDDATATEHGFVSWFGLPDGRIGVVWLDGRDLAGEELVSSTGEPLGTSLRYAYLGTDGGLLAQGVIDQLACDCCPIDVAMTDGSAAVIYRDRSPEEVRDIAVRVATAEGWSAPVTLGPDGWQIEGCPVNGPAIVAAGTEVAAAWFTAAGGRGRVRAARSSDGGRSFGRAIDVDTDRAIGHVGVVLGRDGAAVVSWWRRGPQGGAELALRAVRSSGELGPVAVVANTSLDRPETIPQLERSGSRLVLAWMDEDDPGQVIRLVYVE